MGWFRILKMTSLCKSIFETESWTNSRHSPWWYSRRTFHCLHLHSPQDGSSHCTSASSGRDPTMWMVALGWEPTLGGPPGSVALLPRLLRDVLGATGSQGYCGHHGFAYGREEFCQKEAGWENAVGIWWGARYFHARRERGARQIPNGLGWCASSGGGGLGSGADEHFNLQGGGDMAFGEFCLGHHPTSRATRRFAEARSGCHSTGTGGNHCPACPAEDQPFYHGEEESNVPNFCHGFPRWGGWRLKACESHRGETGPDAWWARLLFPSWQAAGLEVGQQSRRRGSFEWHSGRHCRFHHPLCVMLFICFSWPHDYVFEWVFGLKRRVVKQTNKAARKIWNLWVLTATELVLVGTEVLCQGSSQMGLVHWKFMTLVKNRLLFSHVTRVQDFRSAFQRCRRGVLQVSAGFDLDPPKLDESGWTADFSGKCCWYDYGLRSSFKSKVYPKLELSPRIFNGV